MTARAGVLARAARPPVPLPVARRSPALAWFFSGVMARAMRRSFRAVRLLAPGLPPLPPGRPLVIYSNHPSWWDPAFYMALHPRLFPGREGYGPIEAAQLRRYRFFARVGLWGVEEGRAGAASFLRTAEAILQDPARVIWMTAQGRFADPRERPLRLRAGLSHLLARAPHAIVLPLALEYPFWGERRPEALAHFGPPLDGAEGLGAAAWAARLEEALTEACDRLAAASAARDPSAFVTILDGRRGVCGPYGLWQRLLALLTGRRHDPDHVSGQGGRP